MKHGDQQIGAPLTMAGLGRIIRHADIELSGIGKGGTAPAETRLGNVFGYAFTIGDDGYTEIEIPQEWDSSTTIQLQCHIYTNEAYATRSGEVRFKLDWSSIAEDVNEAVDAPTHSGTLTGDDLNIATTAKGLQEYVFGSIAAASLARDDILYMKVERIALTAGVNPVAEPVITSMEMEYTANLMGEAI
jgi:hypothetical protein